MLEGNNRILIIGVGNLLLGDEGVGIHAINLLQEEQAALGPAVEIIDGGTAGLDLLFWLEDASSAIIIDCMDAGEVPGTIFRLPAEELISISSNHIASLHDISLQEVLLTAKKLGKLPPTVVFGIQPEKIGYCNQLSPEVKSVLPRLLQLIKQEMKII
ncbi:MAG: Hydrogenase 2 maturation protease [Pelotomaculum sp. PtaB.Bin104]|nr:MAG: Hydrogenase 2 maturation protease [Pelotomaculum sp. PtaB.Bin104]